MINFFTDKISKKLGIDKKKVSAVISLLDEGATRPFIARYRKEQTGSLDEVIITQIKEKIDETEIFEKRKTSILKSLTENNFLTKELENKINSIDSVSELEDIYLPFKPKRKTKAYIAREKGLGLLAEKIISQKNNLDPLKEAEKFIDPSKEIFSVEQALEGAKFIIAENISEDSDLRGKIRNIFINHSIFKSKIIKKKEKEALKFKDYFDFEEPAIKSPGHRILAIFRGHNLGFLSVSIRPDKSKPILIIKNKYLKKSPSSFLIEDAIEDSYKRLIMPSMETEQKNRMKEKADLEAIEVFASNLHQLLMEPPLGRKTLMALDPGIRTGCKAVVLDNKGDLIEHFVIFPFQENKKNEAEKIIREKIKKYKIEAIAVGNGTGGKETQEFIEHLGIKINVILTDENGASVYSASETARQEFPDHDLTIRGAVSIGRRLMDPLAELVKIDPKSIGVGQYQHDVNQKLLKLKLDNVVISCVNQVGVNLNLASPELLSYVSGLSKKMAKAVVSYRTQNGGFKKRSELKKIANLGPKTFEQCAGFLRINNGQNPLDSTAVHPESYNIVEKMAGDLNCTIKELIKNKSLRDKIDLKLYTNEKTGMPTLMDIMSELEKPGRDPRAGFEIFSFKKDINTIEDLKEGMTLPGIVTNVTGFGAFINIGVHQDGLVHISEMSHRFIKDPSEIVKVRQKVNVKIISIDKDRKRIGLSFKI
ncbi:MAG: RNA-binding transcriptional accessory protein [Deltaproteobacteria bacterium]|nr:MAG: RNA-binding transcriptional accessory protein [Deltaproteobacteria bacterium]